MLLKLIAYFILFSGITISVIALEKPKWKAVEKFQYDWSGDGINYEFVLELPFESTDADPGQYARLTVESKGNNALVLEKLNGVEMSAVVKNNDVAQKSKRVSFVPLSGNKLPPVAILENWAFASNPGEIIILGIVNRKPTVLFRKNFEIIRFEHRQSENTQVVIGWGDYGQCTGKDLDLCTYNPMLALKIDGSGSNIKIKIDPTLSKKINQDTHYPWAGIKANHDIMVYKKTRFMTAKEYNRLFEKVKK